MRLYQISPLYESRGFSARTSGEQYIDPTNPDDIATFIGYDVLPEKGIAFNTYQDLLDAYNNWKETADNTVYEINKPKSNMRGAMIINLDTIRGLESFVLFVQNVADLSKKLNKIEAGVIPGHGGYVYNRDVATSERAGVKPADVVKSEKLVSINGVAALLDPAKIQSPEIVEQMQEYLKALAAGKGANYLIKNGAKNAKVHQKYLGEWASPIALITGQFEPKSILSELKKEMIAGGDFKKGKIIFNTDPTAPLFDSSVIVNPYEVFISTKAKGTGAAASLDGLYNAMIDKKEQFSPAFWRRPKAKKFRDIIVAIIENSSLEGILKVAQIEGLISNADIKAILDSKASERLGSKEFKSTSTLNKYMNAYKANKEHSLYSAWKHAVAGIGRALVQKLNDEDFTDIYKEVLNHANVVQMYFNAKPKGSDLLCVGFNLVWPPVFTGKIKFDAHKNFSATDIKGKLGFKVGPDTPEKDDIDPTLNVPVKEPSKKAIQKAKDVEYGIIRKPGEREIRDPRVKDIKALGREKK